MRKSRTKSAVPPKPEWAALISDLRQRLNLSQLEFGRRLHSSPMGVSRWERGEHEPSAGSYLELGTLAGAPLCWYFWGRAGLRTEDVMRVLPKAKKRFGQGALIELRGAHAGSAGRKPSASASPLVAIPLLKAGVATHGGRGDSSTLLHDAPVEGIVAAPFDWCPNPDSTTCLRVRGDSMRPLIYDGYILAVDSSQTNFSELNGKMVIAWNKDMGLTVSRLQHYDHTDLLQPENRDYESIVLNQKTKWKILAKVLWWMGKAP
jgi:transcriptional regulator with XRE-family HTH domain